MIHRFAQEISPSEEDIKFWNDFAFVLKTNPENLFSRLKIQITSNDDILLQKIGPYLTAALKHRVMTDVTKHKTIIDTLENKGLEIEYKSDLVFAGIQPNPVNNSTYDVKIAPPETFDCKGLDVPESVLTILDWYELYSINNTDFPKDKNICKFKVRGTSERLSSNAHDYCLNLFKEHIQNDFDQMDEGTQRAYVMGYRPKMNNGLTLIKPST